MFDLSEAQMTLLAASIAAVVSLLTLVVTLVTARQAEQRLAQRNALQTVLDAIGKEIHEVTAITHVALHARTNDEDSRKKWRDKAQKAGETLKARRREVRYSLWGLDKGIHTLSRLPDWTSHLLDYPDAANRLLKRGDKLRKSLDLAIHRAYLHGVTPSLFQRLRVRWHVWRLEATRNEIMGTPKEERT